MLPLDEQGTQPDLADQLLGAKVVEDRGWKPGEAVLRTDKVSLAEKKVELLGKGGKTRNIRLLDPKVLTELDFSQSFIY